MPGVFIAPIMYSHKNGITWRKVERSDLSDLLTLKNESWWGVHTTPIINTDDQQRWFDSLSNNTVCMIAQHNSKNVGFLLVDHIDWLARTASIGGSVYKESRQSEISILVFQAGVDFAFEFLNLYRLNAEVLETNYAVQKIDLGVLGFTVEGTKRSAVYKCGCYYDSLVLGLLRTEWEQQERVKGYGGSCNTTWDHAEAKKKSLRAKRWRNNAQACTNPDAVLQSPTILEESPPEYLGV